MLDKGGAVKKFVDALQQLTNPDMIFKVNTINPHTNPPPHCLCPLSLIVFTRPSVTGLVGLHEERVGEAHIRHEADEQHVRGDVRIARGS